MDEDWTHACLYSAVDIHAYLLQQQAFDYFDTTPAC